MSFSTDLQAWSSHKALLSLHDFEINLYEGIKRFLSNRIKSDLEYAKNLASLTDNARRLTPNELYTPFSKVWSNVLHQISELSGMISSKCVALNETCIPKLEHLIGVKKTSMKSFDGQRNKFSSELQRLEDEVKRNGNYYEKQLQKFCHLKEKMNVSKKGQSYSRSEDLCSKMMGVSLKIHSAHNAYLISLKEYNSYQKHHNSVLLPGLLDGQQEFMEASLMRCQDILSEFFNFTNYAEKNFQSIHDGIMKLIMSVNPNLEYTEFVATFRSDPVIFIKKEFDPSLSDNFLGISDKTDLLVDESTCDDLKKIEMSMMERLLMARQNLVFKKKELQSLEGERSSFDNNWAFDLNLNNLKREVFELQCFEQNYNSLVTWLSEAIKTTNAHGLTRTVESFDNLENNTLEKCQQSDDNSDLIKSTSLQFFGQIKTAKKTTKTKLEKILQSVGKKMESRAGYEESNSFRFQSRIKRNRSSSLKDNQDAEDESDHDQPDVSHLRHSNGIERKNRSISLTRLSKRDVENHHREEEEGEGEDSVQNKARQKRKTAFTDKIKNQGARATPIIAAAIRGGDAEEEISLGSHRGNSFDDSSSSSSSESLRLKLASKPPPPLPPAKDQHAMASKSSDIPLTSEEWFHGLLPREEVLQMLQNEGDFLVRTTRNKVGPGSAFGSHRQQQFVLSVCSRGGHKHFIIQESEDGFHFEDEFFPTVKELIHHYVREGVQVTERSQAIIKNPILRQAWELRNDDIRLLEKIGSGQFGEVYKGILTIRSQQNSSVPKAFIPRNLKALRPAVPPKPNAGLASPVSPLPPPSSSPLRSPSPLKSPSQPPLPTPKLSSETIVAVKICKDSLDDENRARFLKEAKILRLYRHRNIVGFIGVATLAVPVLVVMEFVEGGSLLNFVRKNSLSQQVLLSMCIDVASGMAYLESMKCIHRDLAARNCLVSLSKEGERGESQQQQNQQQYTIKISDFGMSKIENEYVITSGSRQIPIKWTSPEALTLGKYTTASDVWSFGVVVWEIFSNGRVPYQGMSNAVASELVEKGHRLPETENMPSKLYELLLKCWYKEPEERPNFQQILKFLQEIKSHTS